MLLLMYFYHYFVCKHTLLFYGPLHDTGCYPAILFYINLSRKYLMNLCVRPFPWWYGGDSDGGEVKILLTNFPCSFKIDSGHSDCKANVH